MKMTELFYKISLIIHKEIPGFKKMLIIKTNNKKRIIFSIIIINRIYNLYFIYYFLKVGQLIIIHFINPCCGTEKRSVNRSCLPGRTSLSSGIDCNLRKIPSTLKTAAS